MKTSINTFLIFFAILFVGAILLIPVSLVAAQVLQRPPQPSPDAQATVQAMVTQRVIEMTLSAPTPLPPTPIIVQITNTPVPTSTATPTAVTYCDWVSFLKDVTVPDGTKFSPNESFTKVWRLQNRGSCTWNQDYMLVFSSGAQMGATTAVRLPYNVAPGQTVDVSVTLTAPGTAGHYTGYWMLRNSAGVLFGYGDKSNKAFYVDIVVKQIDVDLPLGTVTGNLCYPSEFNPPMTLYFERVGTVDRIQFAIPQAQNSYTVLLQYGSYFVYAWAPGYNLEGAYVYPDTGLMKPVQVFGGQTTANINLCDWSPNPHERGQ